MNKLYVRGIIAQCWYNFTETLVQGILLKPTPKELIYTKKVKYGSDKLQYINTYSRRDMITTKKPLLIYIHGGSWVSGITEMRNSYISEWAKKGFFTAAISYSYAPQKVFPHQLKEVFAAIDYIIDNANKCQIDTDNIVLAGESAGGYFISYVASCIYAPSVLESLGINFKHQNDIKIKALVSISGCFDLRRLSETKKPQASFPDLKTMISSYLGMNYSEAVELLNSDKGALVSPQVNEGYPPTFLIWADKDLLKYETFDFSEELRKLQISNQLYKADGIIGMHAWPIVMLFKKSKICLSSTFNFVLPKLDDLFYKNENGEWEIRNKY